MNRTDVRKSNALRCIVWCEVFLKKAWGTGAFQGWGSQSKFDSCSLARFFSGFK